MRSNRSVTLRITACLICLASITSQLPLNAQPSADEVKANYTKSEHMIPMRDGAKLFVAVYAPKDTSQKYPILLSRTPYSCSPYQRSTK